MTEPILFGTYALLVTQQRLRHGRVGFATDTNQFVLRDLAGAFRVFPGVIAGGDGANTSVFEADGTLRFDGNATVWDDIFFGFEGSKIPGAGFPSWLAWNGNLNAYRFGVGDSLEPDGGEFSHKYHEGSDYEIHIHWATNGTEVVDKYVRWQVEYSITNNNPITGVGDQFPLPVTIAGETMIPANTPTRTAMYTDIGMVNGAGVHFGATMKARVSRIAALGGAAPAADPFGLMMGLHIEMDTVGSRTETTK